VSLWIWEAYKGRMRRLTTEGSVMSFVWNEDGSMLAAAAYGALVTGARELLEQGTSTYAARRVPRDLVERAFGHERQL